MPCITCSDYTFLKTVARDSMGKLFLSLGIQIDFLLQGCFAKSKKMLLKGRKEGEGSTQRYTICCGREASKIRRESLFHFPLELRRRATNHPPLLSLPT